MENLFLSAFHFLAEHRDRIFTIAGVLFSGAGVYLLMLLNPFFRRKHKANTPKASNEHEEGTDPLLDHTTDGYLAQVGVLFCWRFINSKKIISNLGNEAQAKEKILGRLNYFLIEALEKNSLSEIREKRVSIGNEVRCALQCELEPFDIYCGSVKIGRVTPVDHHP